MAQQYPVGVQVWLDGVDITRWVFGEDLFNPDVVDNTKRDVDISSWIKGPGLHRLEVTCTGGVGRVESRVEVS